MEKFRKLFVAIDFSPNSDEALRQAHDRALSTGAQLAVCHIVPNELRSNLLFPDISRIAALKFPLEMKQIAEAAAARVAEITGRTEEEFELIVDDGTPQALILNRAEEWLADLVIVGSHGQTSAADALLGSVTDSVIRHAHCPVLIVRLGKRTGRIVAGTDFSDPVLPALRAAGDEAERTGAKLTVVHSLDMVWSLAAYPALAFGGAPFNVSAEQIKELELVATQRLEESLKQLNVSGDTLVTIGPAGKALIDIASERKADLIVVGTIGRTGLRRALLGSVAETVAKGAPCSVLIIRQHPG
ncbi:MAG TPA: universal stress protein [Blastocatellia bacterium]|nr:universal stress protein [Blastocatellia bacterium]